MRRSVVLITTLFCLLYLHQSDGQRQRNRRRQSVQWTTLLLDRVETMEKANIRTSRRRGNRIEIDSTFIPVMSNYTKSKTMYDFQGRNLAVSLDVPTPGGPTSVCLITSSTADFNQTMAELVARNISTSPIRGVSGSHYTVTAADLILPDLLEEPPLTNLRRFCEQAMDMNAVFRMQPATAMQTKADPKAIRISGLVSTLPAQQRMSQSLTVSLDKTVHDHFLLPV